jgi:low affinity Fe/Cu permease
MKTENNKDSGIFATLSKWTAKKAGHSSAFTIALAIILIWAVTGPVFNFSDTWQLFINTGTTIVTFLMVFLIQNSQNRDTIAMHLKLDEILRATKGAHNELVDIEDLEEKDLEEIKKRYEDLAHRIKVQVKNGKLRDTGTPRISRKKNQQH